MHICQLMVHVLHVYMYQFLFTFTSNHFGVDSGYWSALSGRTIWSVGYSIKFFPWRFSHNDFFWSNWWYLEWRKHNTGIDAETCDLSKLNWQIKNLKMTYFSVSVNLKFKMLLWCDLSSFTFIHLLWYFSKWCALYIYSRFLRDNMGQDNDNLSKSVCL